MPKLNRAARREALCMERAETRRANASIMSAFKQARDRVALLKAQTPKSLWPAAWVQEEQELRA